MFKRESAVGASDLVLGRGVMFLSLAVDELVDTMAFWICGQMVPYWG
jgi:hypothetical protein